MLKLIDGSDAKITIVPKFRDALPPLEKTQFEELERAILEDGRVRDPLVLRKSDGALVEGHHRLQIARAHKIPFSAYERDFDDDNAVFTFIYLNAISRRNLSAAQISLYRGRAAQALSVAMRTVPAGAGRAVEVVAEASGVDCRTVSRDVSRAKDVAKLASSLARAYEDGGLVLTAAELHSLASKDQATQIELSRRVRVGDYPSWEAALGLATPKKRPAAASEESDSAPKPKGGRKPAKAKGEAKKGKGKKAPEPAPALEPAPLSLLEIMEAWNKTIEALAKGIADVEKQLPEGPWMDANRRAIIGDAVKSAAETLRQIKAKKACGKCEGDGCVTCRKSGWIPRMLAGADE